MSRDDFLNRLVARATAAGVDVSPGVAIQLESYYRLLAHWNASINLTALKLDPVNDHAIDRLLIEPLTGSRYIPMESAVWFDLGSGGGSPAIPLKIARPAFSLTMVESRERKAAFLREAVRVLDLEDASVEAERIETVAEKSPLAGSVDLITVRAVRIDPPLFGSIKALMRFGGRVVLFGTRPEGPVVQKGFRILDHPASPPGSASDVVVLERTGGL